jgi:hypothetical protein
VLFYGYWLRCQRFECCKSEPSDKILSKLQVSEVKEFSEQFGKNQIKNKIERNLQQKINQIEDQECL